MALIGMRDVTWGFDNPPLLENITFQVEKSERVCLVGRNGVGKTTLFRILSGLMAPDRGEVWRQRGVKVGLLAQEVLQAQDDKTVFELVLEGLGEVGRKLALHGKICKMSSSQITPELLKRGELLQNDLDSGSGWELMRKAEAVLSRLEIDPEAPFSTLSAGMKRQVLFAGAVADDPDVLLLDEPTNHLDIDGIVRMENYILKYARTLLFITHDRAFMKKIATRVLELDRATLYSHDCDYETYIQRRQSFLDAEERQDRVFDKKLSREEAWIRQGIKARRTRNQGRVGALLKMREQYRSRREKISRAQFQIQEARRTGKLVIEAKSIGYSFRQKPIIQDFSTIIMRGDKVGIIGPNGSGKTTFLQILLGELPPDTGIVRHGVHLQPAYFDQLRKGLDEEKTVAENIGQGNDFILVDGEKRHVISYMADFLFSAQRCRMPVHVLSGGEKNRLLLARLFSKPANVLILDEPTNDLDAETLELLEELLFQFRGTLLLVSHDREFLNNVVTSTIAFEGEGKLVEYAGGYDDYLSQRPETQSKSVSEDIKPPSKPRPKPSSNRPEKLGYMEKKELAELPHRIEALEAEQKLLYDTLADPQFYKKDQSEASKVKFRVDELENLIAQAYKRWEKLEAKGP